jgi:hypothetical protein
MSNIEKPDVVEADEGVKPQAEAVEELKKTITVDTIHQDEAMRVLANYEGESTWDEKEEKRVQRKIDRRLLPILCATYGLQYYDKAMVSSL